MAMKSCIGCLIVTATLLLSACGKESASPSYTTPESYFALEPGKTIVYQLDSTVKTPFTDTAFHVVSYQAKDVIDAPITDILGRPGWRVYRYLRPLNSTDENDWVPNMTYQITPLRNAVEVIEHNLRFQKLAFPISEDITWRGNRYINTTPGGPLDYYDSWQYRYSSINQPFDALENGFDSTITIVQTDEALGVIDGKPENAGLDAYYIYSVEVYAKNVGLIYKDFRHWKYSPFPGPNSQGEGIRLRLTDHY